MARISGVNIPTNKRVLVALTYIYGIGPKIAVEICSKASIELSKRVNQLTDEEVNKIREIIDNKRFAELNVHPSGDAFKNLTSELRENIPAYINKNVNLERFQNVG